MATKMPRWRAGVTHQHHVRNDIVLQRFGVALIAENCSKLGCLSMDTWECSGRIIGLTSTLGKRPGGRPKQQWLDTLRMDLKAAGLHPDQALNQEMWRKWTWKINPVAKEVNAEEKTIWCKFTSQSLKADIRLIFSCSNITCLVTIFL